jgi:hypothetical protein
MWRNCGYLGEISLGGVSFLLVWYIIEWSIWTVCTYLVFFITVLDVEELIRKIHQGLKFIRSMNTI